MAKIDITGVTPEREAYIKGQERGITSRGGVSPQRQAYMDSNPASETIEARPVNPGRTAMQQRPITSSIPRIGVNPVDMNEARKFASDMVNKGDYKNPDLKPKLQEMFPSPKGYKKGGIVPAKVSTGEFKFEPEEVAFFGNDFIQKLIGNSNNDSNGSNEYGKGGCIKGYAKGDIVPPPVTDEERLKEQYLGNPPDLNVATQSLGNKLVEPLKNVAQAATLPFTAPIKGLATVIDTTRDALNQPKNTMRLNDAKRSNILGDVTRSVKDVVMPEQASEPIVNGGANANTKDKAINFVNVDGKLFAENSITPKENKAAAESINAQMKTPEFKQRQAQILGSNQPDAGAIRNELLNYANSRAGVTGAGPNESGMLYATPEREAKLKSLQDAYAATPEGKQIAQSSGLQQRMNDAQINSGLRLANERRLQPVTDALETDNLEAQQNSRLYDQAVRQAGNLSGIYDQAIDIPELTPKASSPLSARQGVLDNQRREQTFEQARYDQKRADEMAPTIEIEQTDKDNNVTRTKRRAPLGSAPEQAQEIPADIAPDFEAAKIVFSRAKKGSADHVNAENWLVKHSYLPVVKSWYKGN